MQLAPDNEPQKAFPPRQEGEVFGVMYCTKTFTWWLREYWLSILIGMLQKLVEHNEHTIGFLKTVSGKLVAYKMLVPHGKFYLGNIIRMAGQYNPEIESMEKVIQVSDWCRSEADFWRILLPFCGRRTPLPDPDFHLPPTSLHAFTDAAGGSTVTIGMGCGAVLGSWWTYVPWGPVINGGKKYIDGKMYKHKMALLELLGPLVVVAGASHLVRDSQLIIPVDNSGSVAIFRKGWCSSCMLSTTVVLAIHKVACALNCNIEIVKIRRCSDRLTQAADALSKTQFSKFRKLVPEANVEPGRIPSEIVKWIENPREDRYLGERILKEIGMKGSMLGRHGFYL